MKKSYWFYLVLAMLFSLSVTHAQDGDREKYVKATVGSTVVLVCDTQHTRFDLIEWRRNDTAVPVYMKFQSYPANSPPDFADRVQTLNGKDLEITGVQISDIAVYMCKTMMSTGESSTFERGSNIYLDVQERPSCKGSPPSFITAVAGSSAVLPCTVGGSPEPTISWSRNDGVLPTGRYIITGSGLGIQKIEASDSGRYQVTLTSSAGTYAHVIELVVQSSSTVEPGSYINAVEGRLARLPCGKAAQMVDVSIVWTNKGADATRISRFTVVKSNGELLVDPPIRTDSGVYQCSVRRRQADGSTVTVTYDMYLNVQYLPDIVSYESIIHSFVGGNVVIPCVTVGNPDVTLTWLYDGSPVLSDGTHFLISRNGSLVIYSLTIRDAGVYTCAPTNKLGPGKQRSTSLSVLVPPQFVNEVNLAVAVQKDRNVTFDCLATGTPRPNITWYHLSQVKTLTESSQNEGLLKVNDIQAEHHGIYRCVVLSKAGSLMRDFTLIIIAAPGMPTNFTVQSFNGSAVAKWVPGYEGGAFQTLQLWYRPFKAPDTKWRFVMTNTSALNITDLPVGSHLFAVRGVNKNGKGAFSNIIKVNITGKATPLVYVNGVDVGHRLSLRPPPPFTMSVNITSKGYFLRWLSVLPPGRPASERFILQRRRANSTEPWKTLSDRIGKDTTTYLLHAADINTDDAFEFRMYARTRLAASDYAYPARVYFTALPVTAVIPPRNNDDDDSLPFIILGVILAFILLVLIISLFCFVRTVKRKRRMLYGSGKTTRKVHFDFSRSHSYKPHQVDELNSSACVDVSDRTKLHRTRKELIREASLKGGSKDVEEFQRLLSEENEANNRVQMLLPKGTPDEGHFVRKKYLSLQRSCPYYTHRPTIVKAKKTENKLYKSNSMPCVLFDAKEEDVHVINPEDIVDGDDFDVSDLENDGLGTMTRKGKKSPLKSAKFKDSFDQFCRPTNEDSKAKQLILNPDVDFYVSKNDADSDSGSSKRSPLEGGGKALSNSNARLYLVNGGSKRELSESSGENSSDDVCEGDISGSDQASPKDDRKIDESFHYPNHPSQPPKRFLSMEAVRQLQETASLDRQSCQSLKSSGFESAAPSQCSMSDVDVKAHMPVAYVSSYGSRDSDGGSDYSFRCSPIMGRKVKVYPTIDEPYEWDQDRMSSLRRSGNREHSNHTPELTDNEEFYDNIMNMQRKMGVDLDDSWENLNEKDPLAPLPHEVASLPRKGFAPSYGDRGGAYTDHEKSRRCAQLLQEFKTKKNGSPTHNSIGRSSSVMADLIQPEKPVPSLKRSHSTGGDVVFREWLV